MTFLLDWELTMKCNLDCDYCERSLYGGHDNTTSHPPLDQCLASIDFMFAYVDQAMKQRRDSLKHVVLNIYGGESLYHPDIVQILQAVHERKQAYQNNWHLQVTTTTNAIVPRKRMQAIIPWIDEFTVSWHTANLAKQKVLFRENCLLIKSARKKIKCVVLMHGEPSLFDDAQAQITWCNQHDIPHLPRALDRADESSQFDYKKNQVRWFNSFFTKKSHKIEVDIPAAESTNLSQAGRACCGGRQMCADGNHKQRHFFVPNRFAGWSCSVNHFFLYVKQVTGEVFVNKDCKMNYQGSVGPIGHLSDTAKILAQQTSSPTIVCAKDRCLCGLCAPKAQDPKTYKQIMEKYIQL